MSVSMKKGVSLLLAFALCLSLSGVVYAADNPEGAAAVNPSPQWDNTTSIEVNLSVPNGKAICGVIVIGKPGTTEITGQAVLARKNSNGTYTNVKTWSNLRAVGDVFTLDGVYYVDPGYTYRLTATATVYRNGTGETVTAYHEAYAS